MIEITIRLRSAASNPTSRRRRWGISLAALAIAVVAPVATSRAQDASASGSRAAVTDFESLKAMKGVSVEGGKMVAIDSGESISLTTGAASITLKKDGTIVLKGTDIVIDGANKLTTKPSNAPTPSSLRAAQMSEIF